MPNKMLLFSTNYLFKPGSESIYNTGMLFRDIWLIQLPANYWKNALTVLFSWLGGLLLNIISGLQRLTFNGLHLKKNLFQRIGGKTTLKSTLDMPLWTNKVTGNLSK